MLDPWRSCRRFVEVMGFESWQLRLLASSRNLAKMRRDVCQETVAEVKGI